MKDRFSERSHHYAAFRPTYPPALFNFIFQHIRHFDTAWDAGTGNGQVARDLSPAFSKVLATDISEQQLKNAFTAPNISYSIGGEVTSFADHSIDLITVGQAIHWFDLSKFYPEVKRVAGPDAILAIWGYGLVSVSPDVDGPLLHFYTKVVGPYWDKERKLIDDHYATLLFPFDPIIETPAFSLSFTWSLDEFQGYLGTWSSVLKYRAANQIDPVEGFINDVRPLWKEEKQPVRFPLFLKLARVGRTR